VYTAETITVYLQPVITSLYTAETITVYLQPVITSVYTAVTITASTILTNIFRVQVNIYTLQMTS